MSGTVEARLKSLGLELPVPAAPIANYVGYTIVPYGSNAKLVVVSGQIPLRDGKPQYVGKLGAGMSIAEGQEAAKLCAMNILAQLRVAAGGDLDRVRRCVRVGGFVNCTPDFTQMPQVVNGASDLMVEVFGEAGKHARAAVGVSSLPAGVAVEVEAMFDLGNP